MGVGTLTSGRKDLSIQVGHWHLLQHYHCMALPPTLGNPLNSPVPPFFISKWGNNICLSEMVGGSYKITSVKCPWHDAWRGEFVCLLPFFSTSHLLHIKKKACFLAGYSSPFERAFSALWHCSPAQSTPLIMYSPTSIMVFLTIPLWMGEVEVL